MKTRSINPKHYFLRDINPVVRFFIISDTIVIGASSLLGPIFALFIADFIPGGNEAVAGIAAGIYLFAKSTLQIPVAHLIDKIQGEKDDFWFLITFNFLIALMPLFYLIVQTPLHLYIVQFFLGLFSAFTVPSFMAIFTRHIDKEKEGVEWGVYFTLTDLSSAVLAVLGGFIAFTYGFTTLIFAVVTLSILGSAFLWLTKPYIRLK